MRHNIRLVSTYPPRRCGIGTFSRDLASALAHFTGEVGNIRVAAIDREGLRYSLPVDIVISQYDPESWADATKAVVARAHEAQHPTVVLLQHEYGLDPDPQGHDGEGSNFVNFARACGEAGLTRLVYLHTVLDDPDGHQKETIQQLARCSDGLVVTTESAVETLARTYDIERNKLKHIDHGIRMEHPSQHDRLTIKDSLGLKGFFLATTVGMLSPDKGIQHAIEGYGRFLSASPTESQRRQIVYLVAGSCHPEFMRAEGGEPYREYKSLLEGALGRTALRRCNVKNLRDVDYTEYDVVFLDTFLDEGTLLRLYAATNVMLLPYLNMQQISSGILADTLGSGRVAVSTKFKYALELIHSNRRCPPGVVIGRHARGILVDPAEADQIAEALDYLVFHYDRRLQIEKQAHQRGYQMRWQNSAWAILQHTEFLQEQKRVLTGRGVRFTRERPSVFHRMRRTMSSNNGAAQNEDATRAAKAVCAVRIKET
ncbi:MAG: glycosyltransferase family protein [Planctomycetota bacterium]|jgi:glycosyltransferase involved in cell wall biosynthesis